MVPYGPEYGGSSLPGGFENSPAVPLPVVFPYFGSNITRIDFVSNSYKLVIFHNFPITINPKLQLRFSSANP